MRKQQSLFSWDPLSKKNAVILNPFYARDNAKPPPHSQRA
jgi:hypothetical protein